MLFKRISDKNLFYTSYVFIFLAIIISFVDEKSTKLFIASGAILLIGLFINLYARHKNFRYYWKEKKFYLFLIAIISFSAIYNIIYSISFSMRNQKKKVIQQYIITKEENSDISYLQKEADTVAMTEAKNVLVKNFEDFTYQFNYFSASNFITKNYTHTNKQKGISDVYSIFFNDQNSLLVQENPITNTISSVSVLGSILAPKDDYYNYINTVSQTISAAAPSISNDVKDQIILQLAKDIRYKKNMDSFYFNNFMFKVINKPEQRIQFTINKTTN